MFLWSFSSWLLPVAEHARIMIYSSKTQLFISWHAFLWLLNLAPVSSTVQQTISWLRPNSLECHLNWSSDKWRPNVATALLKYSPHSLVFQWCSLIFSARITERPKGACVWLSCIFMLVRWTPCLYLVTNYSNRRRGSENTTASCQANYSKPFSH